jgi:hypothetical protein
MNWVTLGVRRQKHGGDGSGIQRPVDVQHQAEVLDIESERVLANCQMPWPGVLALIGVVEFGLGTNSVPSVSITIGIE